MGGGGGGGGAEGLEKRTRDAGCCSRFGFVTSVARSLSSTCGLAGLLGRIALLSSRASQFWEVYVLMQSLL